MVYWCVDVTESTSYWVWFLALVPLIAVPDHPFSSGSPNISTVSTPLLMSHRISNIGFIIKLSTLIHFLVFTLTTLWPFAFDAMFSMLPGRCIRINIDYISKCLINERMNLIIYILHLVDILYSRIGLVDIWVYSTPLGSLLLI